LAVRARQLYDAGQTVSADAFVPEYLRKSQAEREREERLAQTAEK
jgi:tRNA A37 threonylcarbamoyladenosine modification protein TsaB